MTTKHRSTGRRSLVLGAAAIGLGLGLVPLAATPAMACSCLAMTDDEYASMADAVFVGRVDEAATAARSATFVVDEVFKGDVHAYRSVVNQGPYFDCGGPWVRGQTMVVFAQYGDDDVLDPAGQKLTAPPCNGTRPMFDDSLTLTAGHAPISGTSAADDDAGFPLLGWLSFVAVAGLSLMPVALWLRLRSRLDSAEPAVRPGRPPVDRAASPHPFA